MLLFMSDIMLEVFTHLICEAFLKSYHSYKTHFIFWWKDWKVMAVGKCICWINEKQYLLHRFYVRPFGAAVHLDENCFHQCTVYFVWQKPLKAWQFKIITSGSLFFSSVSCVNLLLTNWANLVICVKLFSRQKQTPIYISSSKPFEDAFYMRRDALRGVHLGRPCGPSLVTRLHQQFPLTLQPVRLCPFLLSFPFL